MLRAPATLAAALVLATLPPAARIGAAQFSFKTGIDVVGVTVAVVNRSGEPVAGLKAEDFDVLEDGATQQITYFSPGSGDEAVPLHLGLLFDTSGSMEKDLAFSRGAAIRFLNTFPRAMDFTLVDFDTEVRAARFSQGEFPRLVERLRSRKAKGFTALYDALSVYLGSAFDQTGRKVLVLYTDGGDTSSSRTWSEALRVLRASDVTVYAIGFGGGQGRARLASQSRLVDMAELTGGQAMFPNTMKQLDTIYDRIAAEIHTQYTLGYVSSNTARDGKWRKVEVRLKRAAAERLRVRTREGYFAPVSR
jgi:Ca-activated chloride channel family protein